ncbi:MAG: DsbA family protein [Flavobacteriales bacterium]|nr:DsbA family protein [Flavobacteriales bacterium]
MSQNNDIHINCDPETGLCKIPEFAPTNDTINWKSDEEIIYIGDPMCSWCWGISPQLNALKRYGEQKGIPFKIVMGGLRPGGGDKWNIAFKDFLKHHWEEVNKRSNQPFGYKLFDLEHFNYDTEPACRAVVTAKNIAPQKAHSFYELTQYYFYVESKDPKELTFYEPICEKLKIDFNIFKEQFSSEEMKNNTHGDFSQSRQLGVSGFPSVLFRKEDQLHFLARGYASYKAMKERLETLNK